MDQLPTGASYPADPVALMNKEITEPAVSRIASDACGFIAACSPD
jgi:hypothetical protein